MKRDYDDYAPKKEKPRDKAPVDKDDRKKTIKRVALIVGIIITAGGLVGFLSFFFALSSGGEPTFLPFWVAPLSIILIFLGSTTISFSLDRSHRSGRYSTRVSLNHVESEIDQVKTNNEKVQCPSCHSLNDKKAKYCNYCGVVLNNICPSCGSENDAEAKYCRHCGRKI